MDSQQKFVHRKWNVNEQLELRNWKIVEDANCPELNYYAPTEYRLKKEREKSSALAFELTKDSWGQLVPR